MIDQGGSAAERRGALRNVLPEPVAEPARLVAALVAAVCGFGLVALSSAPSADTSFLGRLAIVLAAVALPAVAALAVVAPWSGLLAWLLVMPLLNVSRAAVDIGSAQVISSTVVAASLAVGTVLECRAGRLSPTLATLAGVLFAAAVLLLAAGSTVAGGDLGTSVPVTLNGLVVPALVAALVLAMRPSRERLLALMAAMAGSVTVASAYDVARGVREMPSLQLLQQARVDLARFTYYNVGIFGDVLAMALPLLFALALLGPSWLPSRPGLRRWYRPVAVLALAIDLLATYLTFTKSAWLGALIGSALTLFILARSTRGRVAVVVVAAVIGAFITPYPADVLRAVAPGLGNVYGGVVTSVEGENRANSWDPGTAEGEVSIDERLRASRAGIAMAIDHPLLGVGPARFGAEYAGPYRDPNATRGLDSPHDFPIDLAAEYGLPLAVLVLGLLAAAFLLALRAVRASRVPAWTHPAAGIAGGLAGFAVVAVTFGVDLYRPYRYMDSDVVFAALLATAAFALWLAHRHVDVPAAAQPERVP